MSKLSKILFVMTLSSLLSCVSAGSVHIDPNALSPDSKCNLSFVNIYPGDGSPCWCVTKMSSGEDGLVVIFNRVDDIYCYQKMVGGAIPLSDERIK